MRKEDGISLIALVVTIIVLLILAGVTLVTLTGENGLLTRATGASKETLKAEAKEQVSLGLSELKINNLEKSLTSEIILDNEKGLAVVQPKVSNLTGNTDEIKGTYTNDNNKSMSFTINMKDLKVYVGDEIIEGGNTQPGSDGEDSDSSSENPDSATRTANESLLMWIKQTDTTGYYDVSITADGTEYVYPVYLYVVNDKLTTYTESVSLSGDLNDSDFKDNILNKRILIYKYKGDLTINENVIVKPYTSYKCTRYKSNNKKDLVMEQNVPCYGPLALFMFVEGTFTNNGEVSMKDRGAKSAGMNVVLWKHGTGNSLRNYYYVSKEGGNALKGVYVTSANKLVFAHDGLGNVRKSSGYCSAGGRGTRWWWFRLWIIYLKIWFQWR